MPSQAHYLDNFDCRSHYSDSAATNVLYSARNNNLLSHSNTGSLQRTSSQYESRRGYINGDTVGGSVGKSNQQLCSCDADTEIYINRSKPLYHYSLDRKNKIHTYTCEQNAQILIRLERERRQRDNNTSNKPNNKLNYSYIDVDLLSPPPTPIINRKPSQSSSIFNTRKSLPTSKTPTAKTQNFIHQHTYHNTNTSPNSMTMGPIRKLKKTISPRTVNLLKDCTDTLTNQPKSAYEYCYKPTTKSGYDFDSDNTIDDDIFTSSFINNNITNRKLGEFQRWKLGDSHKKLSDQYCFKKYKGNSPIVAYHHQQSLNDNCNELIFFYPHKCDKPLFSSSKSIPSGPQTKSSYDSFHLPGKYSTIGPTSSIGNRKKKYNTQADRRYMSTCNLSSSNIFDRNTNDEKHNQFLVDQNYYDTHQQQHQKHNSTNSINLSNNNSMHHHYNQYHHHQPLLGSDYNFEHVHFDQVVPLNDGHNFSNSLTRLIYPSPCGTNTPQDQQCHHHHYPFPTYHMSDSSGNVGGQIDGVIPSLLQYCDANMTDLTDPQLSEIMTGSTIGLCDLDGYKPLCHHHMHDDPHLHNLHHHHHHHLQQSQQQLNDNSLPWRHRNKCPSLNSSSSGTSIGKWDPSRHWLAVTSILLIAGAAGVAVPLALRVAAGAPFDERLAAATQLLNSVPLIDGHNDLPWNIRKFLHNQLNDFKFDVNLSNVPPWSRSQWSHTDLFRLKKGQVSAQFWAAYVPCEAQHRDAVQLTLEQIDVILRLTEKYSPQLTVCTSVKDIIDAHKNHQLCSLTGVEGGHSMGSSLSVLRAFYSLGVRYMTLTSTCHTPWADSSRADAPKYDVKHGGLTDFGKIIIREMNRLGMIVDLSHVSVGTMKDALAVSEAPVIFSHSSAYHLCNSSRNVQDEILEAIRDNRGLVMVNFYSMFLTCSESATVRNAVDVSTYPVLFAELLGDGWTAEDLAKLAGQNFLRVLGDVESLRDIKRSQGVRPYEDVLSVREDPYNCTTS